MDHPASQRGNDRQRWTSLLPIVVGLCDILGNVPDEIDAERYMVCQAGNALGW